MILFTRRPRLSSGKGAASPRAANAGGPDTYEAPFASMAQLRVGEEVRYKKRRLESPMRSSTRTSWLSAAMTLRRNEARAKSAATADEKHAKRLFQEDEERGSWAFGFSRTSGRSRVNTLRID